MPLETDSHMARSKLTSVVFPIVGVAALAGALVTGVQRWQFVSQAKTADATVIRLVNTSEPSEDPMYAPVFAFEVDGKRHEVESEISSNPPAWSEGDTAAVLYDPADPSRAQLKSFAAQWWLPLALFGVAALFLGVKAIELTMRRRAVAAGGATS